MIYGILGLEIGLVFGVFLEALVASRKVEDLEIELARYRKLGTVDYLRKMLQHSKDVDQMLRNLEDLDDGR